MQNRPRTFESVEGEEECWQKKEKRKEYIQVRELVYFGFDYRLAFSSEPVGGDDLWRMVISFSFFSLYS